MASSLKGKPDPQLRLVSDEEAVAIAESFAGYTSKEAKEIIRQALRYADAVEHGFAHQNAQ